MAVTKEQRDEEVWTVAEFARAGKYSFKHSYELVTRQVFPAIRRNGRWQISRADAERYIAAHRKAGK